jgi:hypothetical protein
MNIFGTNWELYRRLSESDQHQRLVTHPSPDATALQVIRNGSDSRTIVAAYTGTAVNALTLVATNFYMGLGATPSFSCCISFAVTQGTVYSLQVTGYGGVTVDFRIAVTFVWAAPRNDAFSAAGTTLPANGTTLGATMETGERVAIVGRGASGSVWYSFSAAADGNMQVLGPGHFETPPNAPIPQALARTSVNCTVVPCGL